ncbi:MAG: YihY/virulence factor BrkB family protein [Alphaproteobacteria bacterium]|nr:YihY/virulence factor BrkB family protein [Alphaproteobacteria bacterium]
MKQALADVWRRARQPDPTGWARVLRPLHHVRLVLREGIRDRIHIASGFDALWCLEAVAPFAVLVVAVARWWHLDDALVGGFEHALPETIFGYTSKEAAGLLQGFVDDASLPALGVAGVISALFITWQLYAAVLYDLRRLTMPLRHLGVGRHLGLFVVFGVWFVALMGGGLVASASAHDSGWGIVAAIGPIAWSTVVIALGIRWFTQAAVGWRPAFVGAAWGAVWWEIIKSWFWIYTRSDFGTSSLADFYAALGFVPILMFWTQLTWFSVLLAAVVARYLSAPGVHWSTYNDELDEGVVRHPSADGVRRVWRTLDGHTLSLWALSERSGLHPRMVHTLVGDLEALDLVTCGAQAITTRQGVDADEAARRWSERCAVR